MTLYVNIVNASPGGLFVQTHTPFHPGEQVKVRWAFPKQNQEHQATAKVVWRREDKPPPGMGLEFIELTPETKDALRKMEEGEGSDEADG